eukprot:c53393_g1_i1 orf=199-597(+)
MGSLMAGWDSPVFCSKKGRLDRKPSFTKEEIDSYWKMKRESEEEHFRAATESAEHLKVEKTEDAISEANECLPKANTISVENHLENLSNHRDWWTKSSWAFLNDPKLGQIESQTCRYRLNMKGRIASDGICH